MARIREIDLAALPSKDPETAAWEREQGLLQRMQEIAEETRHLPDAKTRWLIEWIRRNQCPELPAMGKPITGPPPTWTDCRVLIFTENRQGTKRYLKSTLEQAIFGTDQADERIDVIDGLTSPARRREIQRRFNADPADEPLRILIATDAAREGLNLQARCSDMFHFDLPWNPGRIEQRNGRIDRKLQPATEVTCHYFVLPQRVEDRVLEVLVRKTETIKKELGGLPKVIEDAVEQRLIRHGIRHSDAEHLRYEIKAESPQGESTLAAAEEIEAARERREDLEDQIERCRKLLEKSRDWVRFSAEPFRQAINCSLRLLGASELAESAGDNGHRVWTFPALEQRAATDPSWTSTLDSLRVPRRIDQKIPDWRRDAPLRPVVFEDTGRLDDQTVHLHLEQRVAQRLLARFRSQGFIYHDLSRACLAQTKDSIPRVILLGRLSLYGRGAERLHEQIIPVAARWSEPERRSGPLRAYAREAQERTMRLLDASLDSRAREPDEMIRRRLLASAPQDIADLRPQLEPRAEEFAAVAEQRLAERGRREERSLRETLERHRAQVVAQLEHYERDRKQLSFGFNAQETKQLNADIRHWHRRLAQFDEDLVDEPARVREFYEVHVKRVEPVGLVYLWPETN